MRLAASPVPVSSSSDSLTTPPSSSFDAGDHAVGFTSSGGSRAEVATGQLESVEVGRAVLLVVEQIDQLPGVRTDVGNADGHRPVGDVVRKQHVPLVVDAR